ncbi:hypothetical protein [Methylophaga sp.]|uniref:hypothetical protein n=1 Tax=Methylophaga sp. TaxID=2024840 RepID=UPI0027174802|nr:hypothetical protein [Methylophaga sp.]MDO8827476.1 hypothetical protein [Methylophaga sp.]
MNSYEYIQEIKRRNGLDTDYAVAIKLGWKPNKIYQYRDGQGMDNAAALQVAEVLDVPVLAVIADMEAQRAKDDVTRNKWIQLAKSTGVAGMLALSLNVVPMLVNPAVSTVSAGELNGNNIHYTNLWIGKKLSRTLTRKSV